MKGDSRMTVNVTIRAGFLQDTLQRMADAHNLREGTSFMLEEFILFYLRHEALVYLMREASSGEALEILRQGYEEQLGA